MLLATESAISSLEMTPMIAAHYRTWLLDATLSEENTDETVAALKQRLERNQPQFRDVLCPPRIMLRPSW